MFEDIVKGFGGIGTKAGKGSDRPDPRPSETNVGNSVQTSDLAEQVVPYPVYKGGRALFVDPLAYAFSPAGLMMSLMEAAYDTPDTISYNPVVIEFDKDGKSNHQVVNVEGTTVDLTRLEFASNDIPNFGFIVVAERKDTQLGTSTVTVFTGASSGDSTTKHQFSVGTEEFKAHILHSIGTLSIDLTTSQTEGREKAKEFKRFNFNSDETSNRDVRILKPFGNAYMGIAGQNVTVTVYPVPFTRNLALQIEDAIASDTLAELSANIITQH